MIFKTLFLFFPFLFYFAQIDPSDRKQLGGILIIASIAGLIGVSVGVGEIMINTKNSSGLATFFLIVIGVLGIVLIISDVVD